MHGRGPSVTRHRLGTQNPLGPVGRDGLSHEEPPWVKSVASGLGKAVSAATGEPLVHNRLAVVAVAFALAGEVPFERTLFDRIIGIPSFPHAR